MNIQSFCSLTAEEIAKMPDKIIEISLSQKEPYTIYQYNLPSLDFDCYSVHSPFYDAHGFSLIDVAKEDGHTTLEILMEFTEEIAQHVKHKVSLIIHCACGLRAFEDFYNEKIIDACIELFPKFPDVDISIENGLLDAHNSCWLDEPVIIVEELNRAIPGNRFHTTLDIWRAQMMERGLKVFDSYVTLDWFMERYAPTCNIIHLAKNTKLTKNPLEWRESFREGDPELERVMNLYKKYNMTATLTIGLDGNAMEEFKACMPYL